MYDKSNILVMGNAFVFCGLVWYEDILSYIMSYVPIRALGYGYINVANGNMCDRG